MQPVEDGEVSDRLRRAEALAAAGEWKDAAAQYAIVLAKGAGRLRPSDESGRKEDAARRALRALLAWPEPGRRAAAAVWKEPAEALLAREGTDRTADLLVDLYPLSEAAVRILPRAVMAAAEAGRLGRVSELLDRLSRLDPEAHRTLAASGVLRPPGERPSPAPSAKRPETAWCAWSAPLVPPLFPAEAHLSRGIVPRSASAAVAADARIFLLEPARTACLDRDTGAVLWESSLLGCRSASVADPCGGILSGGLLLRLWEGHLCAMDPRTGKVRWIDAPPAGSRRRIVSPPAASDGRALAAWIEPRANGETAAGLLCARVADGRVLWETELGSLFTSHLLDCGAAAPTPIARGGSAYAATGTGLLARLDAETGRILWLRSSPILKEDELDAARRTSRRWAEGTLLLEGDTLLAASPESPSLLAVDSEDGRTRWDRPRGEAERILSARMGSLLLQEESGIRAVSIQDGKDLAFATLPDGLRAAGRGLPLDAGALLPTAKGIAAIPLQGAASIVPGPGGTPAADLHPGEGGDLLQIGWESLERIPPDSSDKLRPDRTDCGSIQHILKTDAACLIQEAVSAEKNGKEDAAVNAWCKLLRNPALTRWGPIEVPAEQLARKALAKSPARLEAARAAEPGPLDPPFVERDGGRLAEEARRLAVEGRSKAALSIWNLLASASPEAPLRLQARREALRHSLDQGNPHAAAAHAESLLRLSPDAGERKALEAALSAPPLRAFRGRPLAEDPHRLLWHLRGVDGPVAVTRMWETGGSLYTYGSEGLCLRDARSGAARWSAVTGEPERLLSDPSGALLAIRGLEILRIDPETGEGRWILSLPATDRESEGPPAPRHGRPDRPLRLSPDDPGEASRERIEWAAFAAGSMAVRIGERRLAAVDLRTGQLRWCRDWKEPVRAAARPDLPDLFVACRTALHRIGPDGRTAKETPLPFVAEETGILPDGSPYIRALRGIWTDRWIHRDDRRDVREVRLDPSEERLLVLSESDQEGIELVCLSRRDGRILWVRHPPGLRNGTVAAFDREALLVGIDGFKVSAERLELADGRLGVRRLLGGAPRLDAPRILPAGRFAAVWDEACPAVFWVDVDTGEAIRDLRPFGPGPLSVAAAKGTLLLHGRRGISAFGAAAPALEEILAVPEKGAPVEPRSGAFSQAALQLSRWRDSLEAARKDAEAAPKDASARERLGSVREAAALRDPDTIRLPRFARSPRIDGRLDDGWSEAGRVDLTGSWRVEPTGPLAAAPAWKGPADLSARLYAAWDDDFLYLAVESVDDVVVPSEGLSESEDLAKGDCLVIHIDPQDEGLFGADAGDRLVGLALRVPRFAPAPREAAPPGAYAARRADGDREVAYEMAIPWSFLRTRMPPGAGRGSPRINLALSDDDGDGVRQVLTLSPGMDLGRFRRGLSPAALAGAADPEAWLRANATACPAPPLFARLLLE